MLTVFLIILCVSCYTGQLFFNKLFSGSYNGNQELATPVFSTIYGVIVTLITFCMNKFSFHISSYTLILGCINGVILFLYNLGAIQCGRRGPYSFQVIVTLFGGSVVSLVFSAVFLGDTFTPFQLCGIALMLVSFVVMNSSGLKFNNIRKGYFFWVFSLFFTNGFYGVLMDVQQRQAATERNEMIMVTFLSSALISLVYLICISKKPLKAFQMNPKTAFFAVGSSVSAGFAVFILMYLLSRIPSYILFSVDNGLLLTFSTLLSRIVLKEKMNKQSVLGIFISLIGIIVLSL